MPVNAQPAQAPPLPPSPSVQSLLGSDVCRRPAPRPPSHPVPCSGHMKQLPRKNETTSNKVVCMSIAWRVTGCGRAGRVKAGRYQTPPPPPSPFSPVAGPVTGCGHAGRVKQSRYHPASSPLLTLAKRMTGRAGKQGRYPPPPSLSLSPSHPLRGVTGCSRAGCVKQGRYHPLCSAAWVAGDLPPLPPPLSPLS